jgi:acylglycerol lipase
MFHGLNSHIGHGAHLAEFFSHRGLTTVGFDHRGFGRSQGKLGYIDGLKSHLADSM